MTQRLGVDAGPWVSSIATHSAVSTHMHAHRTRKRGLAVHLSPADPQKPSGQMLTCSSVDQPTRNNCVLSLDVWTGSHMVNISYLRHKGKLINFSLYIFHCLVCFKKHVLLF